MSVKKEASGRRSVQVEVEVPGTPEQVWQAIATGPGVSSWFVPTEMVMGDDGKPKQVKMNFGPGMDAVSEVTSWEPPVQFAAESAGWTPNSPPIATQWIVEARSGGMCVVRVVHSLFASTDEWDNQLTGTESGWPFFFRILRLYLAHFSGQACTATQLMANAAGTESDAWAAVTKALGVGNTSVGQKWRAPAGMPSAGGTLEFISSGPPYGMIIRFDSPNSALVSVAAYACGGPIQVGVNTFWFGPKAETTAEREKSVWQEWFAGVFPATS